MTPRIGDVLRELSRVEFRADVQVAHYWTPHNLDLLKNYIFTSKAPSGKKSSVSLLHTFCEAFASAASENRFVVIATYGHGKSHFALTLANYFGKKFDSPECAVVLEATRRAISDQDLVHYGFIESFKQRHQPFLVLILRGDEPGDLATKVQRALKEALAYDESEYGATGLPFWFKSAEEFLVRASKDHRDDANAYLAQFDLDIEALLGKVRDRQASVHGVCVGLVQHLHGFAPNFDVGLSLAEVVKWVLDNKCGEGKPYAGLLVLFDEFSAFVASYSDSNIPGRPLQDLLNGIADARGLAAFIAFAQQDPNDVARWYSDGLKLDNILKELDRLPKTKHLYLHSSLEEVLESYLQKREDSWRELLRDDKAFATGLDDATVNALKAFRKRYLGELGWDTDRFHSLVTLGSYPLHPLTTSILCSVELQATASPRSVLGFVQQAVSGLVDEAVVTDAGPTWIRAVSLVDYFGEMLGKENWQLYSGAISRLSQPDEPDQVTVLKAMLLQSASKVSAEKMGYDKTIAELSGLSVTDANQVLVQLTERGIIRRDAVTGNYTIAPIGWGDRGEQMAQIKTAQVRLDPQTFEPLRSDLEGHGLGPVPVSVAWGHREDWHACQILVQRATLTKQYLRGVYERYVSWKLDPGAGQKARALVVWLIAASDEDVEWYHRNVSMLIKDAFGDDAFPLVLMRPKAPSNTLIERLKRYIALKSFTSQERTQAEQAWYKDAVDQASRNLKDAFDSYFRVDCEPEVPAPFRARLVVANARSLTSVLSEVIQMAYANSPRWWFEHYKLTQGKLRNAVSALCARLIQNGKIDAGFLDNRPLERDIVRLYLIDRWKVLDSTGRPARPPKGNAIHPGWTALDDFFRMGEPSRGTRPILETLLNPPFGYDWNTLALLFASWRAFHRHDLEVLGGWSPTGNDTAVSPRDILEKEADCSIRRRPDPTGEIRDLVQDIKLGKQRPKSQAQAQIQQLRTFLQREGLDPLLKQRVTDAVEALEDGLKNATTYDQEVKQIRLRAEKGNLQQLLVCLSQIRDLPTTLLVQPEMPPADEIAAGIRQGIEHHVEKLCALCSKLERLEDYADCAGRLQLALRQLDNSGLTFSIQKVKDAIKALQQARKDLEGNLALRAKRQVQETLIRSLPSRGRISDLRRALSELNGITPEVELTSLWEQKRDAVSKELARLEDFAKSLDTQLDRVADRETALQLRDDALRRQNLYDDGECSPLIEAGIERCQLLSDFFREIESLRGNTCSCPEDFARDVGRIRSVIDRISEHLSEAQLAKAETVAAGLDASLAATRERVHQRLEHHRQDLRRGVPPDKVQGDVEREASDWTFLDGDDAKALEELRQEVENRIREDAAKKEREAREKAERDQQERVIKSLPERGTMSELRRGLTILDEMTLLQGLEPLWRTKRAAMLRELERLSALADALSATLDRATERRSVESCHAEALQASALCDEETVRQSLDVLLERCRAAGEYFERVEKVREASRRSPGDFERDAEAIRRISEEMSCYLSEAQRSVAQNVMAELNRALSERQRMASERLAHLEQDHARGQSASKIQHDLETGDWAFLPVEASAKLEGLWQQVRERIDNDEAQQVELHFRKISDRHKQLACLESLQRLVQEGR